MKSILFQHYISGALFSVFGLRVIWGDKSLTLLTSSIKLSQKVRWSGERKSGANGAAMLTDEDNQDGHFSLTTPRGGLLRRLGTRSLCCRCLDSIQKTKTKTKAR